MKEEKQPQCKVKGSKKGEGKKNAHTEYHWQIDENVSK